jgi:hypothetical protein
LRELENVERLIGARPHFASAECRHCFSSVKIARHNTAPPPKR